MINLQELIIIYISSYYNIGSIFHLWAVVSIYIAILCACDRIATV